MALKDWLGSLWARQEPAARATPEDAAQATVRTADAPAVGSVVDAQTYPYYGIVSIVDELGGDYYQGTGILLSPTEVLTASHVLWQEGEAPATNITVTDGSSSTAGGTTVDGDGIHFNQVDDTGGVLTFDQSQDDYAVIHLASPLYGAGCFGLLTDYAGGQATVTGYPATGNGDMLSAGADFELLPSDTVYSGPGLGPGSSGGPVWTTGSDGQNYVVGLVSTGDTSTATGYDAQITAAAYTQIEGWLADDGVAPPLVAVDTSLGQTFTPQLTPYTGPVAGLADQYVNVTSDNLNLTAAKDNVFLHSGAGEDALQALGGTNVLDGGTGSNFLVGGTGTDTFFTDDRGAASAIWDTLANFHAGDAATLFGVTQAGFDLAWVDGQGAVGYQGLTLHATAPGTAEASVTLAGYTSAALTNGQLTISFGTTGGSPYMYIHANG